MQREAEKEGNIVKKQNTKLRNNTVFGKSIENPMDKVDVKVVTTRKLFNGLIAIKNENGRISKV